MTALVFTLPDLGEGLTEAEIVRWLVADGDEIQVDQPVVEVETAKAVVEVPSPHAGRVATRHAPEGATLDVGAPLLTVAAPSSSPSASPDSEPSAASSDKGSGNVLVGYGTKPGASAAHRRRRPRGAASAAPAAAGSPDAAPPVAVSVAPAAVLAASAAAGSEVASSVAGSPDAAASAADSAAALVAAAAGLPGVGSSATAVRSPAVASPGPAVASPSPAVSSPPPAAEAPRVISPLVRRLARSSGVDLSTVKGTGPDGVITRHDVQAAMAATAAAAAPAASIAPPGAGERRVPLSGFRKAVSTVLSRSRAEIPEATVWVDVDATTLWDLRERTRGDARSPGLLAYVARFVVAALREYPVFNARLDTGRQEIVELDEINLGIAVQSERGLVVPAVMGAQAMTTAGLDAAIREVTGRARRGESTPAELSAGTFTLNNYGAFRVDGSAAIINHPQVAILGLGRIIDRPWVVDGALTVRKITQLSFVFDHRVCDGGTAAGFMRSVADAIEDPLSALARL